MITNSELIYNQLEPRLDKLGEITLADAWDLCYGQPYHAVARAFKEIMLTMLEQKKAVKVCNGRYNILRANRKYGLN